ncbi:MAG: iron ABC transporter permease [Anaerolineae bacterium]|nr:iron ABC transporter permease [Anaerolineae bacterium]
MKDERWTTDMGRQTMGGRDRALSLPTFRPSRLLSVTCDPSSIVRRLSSVVLWSPLAYLAVFFFYPLMEIFRLSLAPEGVFDLQPLRALVADGYYGRVLWFTAWQAAASTALTLVLGLPAAYAFARYSFPGKNFLRALTTVPFVLPTLVVAAAFTSLLGPRGWLNTWLMELFSLEQPPIRLTQTIWIILLAHAFYNATIVVRIVGGFWANLDPRLEEAAQVLGADRWRTFRHVTLPLLTPALGAATSLVFLFCFTSFGVILVLGGPRFATLEVEIYRQTVHLFHLPIAATLSIVQMAVTFSVMGLYTRWQARASVPLNFRPQEAAQRPARDWRARLLVALSLGALLVILLVPLISLVERSLATADGWSLRYYGELFLDRRGSILFVPPSEAIRNSLAFALATVGLSLMIGVAGAYLLARPRRGPGVWLDPIFMLPLGTSAVTLGFGFILALDQPPLNLRTSPALVPLAHTLVAFPFVVRSLLPVLRGLNPRWREAATVLGASPMRVWLQVDLPIIGRAILVGAVFAFTVSLGEFGATALIARPEFPTMPIAIYRFLGQPGALNYGQALAMSVLLMAVCIAGLLLIERFRYRDIGEF